MVDGWLCGVCHYDKDDMDVYEEKQEEQTHHLRVVFTLSNLKSGKKFSS